MKYENHFTNNSRINAISVVSGVMLTLASMFFWMSLAAALGFWTYKPDELLLLGPNFWLLASTAWTVSVLAGSSLSAIASRSVEMKNGILNSITTWAGSYLLFGGMSLTIADSNLRTLLGDPVVGLFWHGFIGDAFSLLAGVAGGVIGTYVERSRIKLFSKEGIVESENFQSKEKQSMTPAKQQEAIS